VKEFFDNLGMVFVDAEKIGEYMEQQFEQRKAECKLMIEEYLTANLDIKPDANGEYEWDITARKIRDGKI
jgi:hypothetical protein